MVETSLAVAAQLAQEFTQRVDHSLDSLRLADGAADARRRRLLLALLSVTNVRLTMLTVTSKGDDALSPTLARAVGARVDAAVHKLCGAGSPWSLRRVEVASQWHYSAGWGDIEEMRSNTPRPTPGGREAYGNEKGKIVGLGMAEQAENDGEETACTDLAIVMMCDGRWPERLLTPLLESFLVHGRKHESRLPEVLAVVCDSSAQRLSVECKLLDLQCSHIRSKQAKWRGGEEKDREDLRAVVAGFGTLHFVSDRVTAKGGSVLLPARFSERLLVLAALVRARSESCSLLATPGPWIETLVHTWLHEMMKLCVIDAQTCSIAWLDARASCAMYGVDAQQFSGEQVSFDASAFDDMSRYGPGAAERLVGSMSRLGLIDMQHLPSALPMHAVGQFRSFAHGVRIIGSCPEHSQSEGGTVSGELPALLPEILEHIGVHLLKIYLLGQGDVQAAIDPFVTTWHHIWAVLRQIVISIFQNSDDSSDQTQIFAAFLRNVRTGVQDLLSQVSPVHRVHDVHLLSCPHQEEERPAAGVVDDDVRCELVLDLDIRVTLGAEKKFQNAVALDVARACGGSVDRVKVLGMRAGSVIVDLVLCSGLHPDGLSSMDAFYFLKQQETSRGSLLLQGKVTRNLVELRLRTPEVATSSATDHSRARKVRLLNAPLETIRGARACYTQAGARLPFQLDVNPDYSRQDLPPPGEEPDMEALLAISRQTLCYMVGTENAVRDALSHPLLVNYCSDAMCVLENPEEVGQDLQMFPRGMAVRLPEVETHTQSFMDAISFALKGTQDDGTIRQALEANSSHADSYVARQWAHRNMLTSRTSTSNQQNHSKLPNLFGPPVTVSKMCDDVANLFQDSDSQKIQNRRVWVDTVQPLHLFITANTLRRPIIIFEPGRYARLQEGATTSLVGVYLPLSCSPDTCIGDPLLLLHKPGGFDLDGTKMLEVQYTSTRLSVSMPSHNSLDQWFAPVMPELPYEGDSVPLVVHESLPLRYFLEDEGCDETLGMYLYTMSINVGGKMRRVVRYPILDPVCIGEGFARHERQDFLTPATSRGEATTSEKIKRALPDGRLITVTCSDKPMDEMIFGAPFTLSQVLADAAGSEASGPTDPAHASDPAQRPTSWLAWFRLQWFSQLWKRDHPDHEPPPDVVDESEEADSQATVPQGHSAASGFREFAFPQLRMQISVPNVYGWRLPVWNASGESKNRPVSFSHSIWSASSQADTTEPPCLSDRKVWEVWDEERQAKGKFPRFGFPPITGPDLARFEFPQYSGSDRVIDEVVIKKRHRMDKQSTKDKAAPGDWQESVQLGQDAVAKIQTGQELLELLACDSPSVASSDRVDEEVIKKRLSRVNKQSTNNKAAPGNSQESDHLGQNAAERRAWEFHVPAMPSWSLPSWQSSGTGAADTMGKPAAIMQEDTPATRHAGSGPGEIAIGKTKRSVEEIFDIPPMPQARPAVDSPNMPDFKSYKDLEALPTGHINPTRCPEQQIIPEAAEPPASTGGLNLPLIGLSNLHLPRLPTIKVPWKFGDSTNTASKPFRADCAASEQIAEDPALMKAKAPGILGFLMKANTPPKSDRYSVIIEKIVPGTSAALAGEVAVGDEVLEISGESINYLCEDGPNSEELMKRLQQKLADSPDHVTLKVLQEDGRTNSYRILRAPMIISGIQGRSEGETGIELTASGKHIIISKIRDGTPAFFSFVLAPGQRIVSINLQRARLEYLEEYQKLDVGPVGHRVTYVVDRRTEYPGDEEDDEEETEEQRQAREDREWKDVIENGKPVMLPIVRQIAVNSKQSKLMQTYRDSNSAFFLASRSGADILPLKKPIVPMKPPKKKPPRPTPKEPPPPPKPKEPEPPKPPPKKEASAKKKPRLPPPKREPPPRKTPPPPPSNKVPPPAPTPKMVGIGMQIGEAVPHSVTGFAKDGAAAGCGLVKVGDQLLTVDGMDVRNASLDDTSKMVLGPEGSEIKLHFSRPPPPLPPKPVKKVEPLKREPPPRKTPPPPPSKKIPPQAPTPKMVGIGMQIGEAVPHTVTGFAKDGAAAGCGLIKAGDQLLTVDGMDVRNASLDDTSKMILGPEGSEIKLHFSRPPPPPPPKPVKKVEPLKTAGVGMLLDIQKSSVSSSSSSPRGKGPTAVKHIVAGMSPEGAAAECGQIKVGDQLAAIDGKECGNLDGKQVAALVSGPEGSTIVLDLLRADPAKGSEKDTIQVTLIRGGSKSARQPEPEHPTPDPEPLEAEVYDVTIIRGGPAAKRRLEEEMKAHSDLCERFEKENMQAAASYAKTLEEEDATYKKICEDIEKENQQAERAYFKSLEDEDQAYQQLLKQVPLEAVLYNVTIIRGGPAAKRRLEDEMKAHSDLCERFEKENMQAAASYAKTLEEEDATYKKICEDIEKENQQAERAYFKSLEDEDQAYQQLLQQVEEENRLSQEAYLRSVKDKEDAYKKQLVEEEAAYRKQCQELEEENRLTLAWWKFSCRSRGADIDPPKKGQTDIEIILGMHIDEIIEIESEFKAQLCNEVAQACKAHADEIMVLNLEQGSIVTRIRFAERVSKVAGRNASQVADDLCEHAKSSNASLYKGTYGSRIVSVQILPEGTLIKRPADPPALKDRADHLMGQAGSLVGAFKGAGGGLLGSVRSIGGGVMDSVGNQTGALFGDSIASFHSLVNISQGQEQVLAKQNSAAKHQTAVAQWAALPSVATWNTNGRNPGTVDGYTCRTGGQKAAGEDENKVLRLKLAALEEMKEKDAREIADLKKKLAAKAPQGMSSVFGGMVGSVTTGAGGFLGSMTKGAGLVTGPNPRVSGAEWSARPSVVTWNLAGRIPENTSGFLHARKEGKVGGLGSLMGSVSMPFAPGKQGKVPPPAPTPKLVGIGMQIGEAVPHSVTGFAKDGAAAGCGLIKAGDQLLTVDGMDVRNASLDDTSKMILGPEGSEIKLHFSRPPPPPPPKPVKKVEPLKTAGVGMLLDIQKSSVSSSSSSHIVAGMSPEGAAAECGQIKVGDQLAAIDGKECGNLDGKQVAALVSGPEGSTIVLDLLRADPAKGSEKDTIQVTLIRGGSKSARQPEPEHPTPDPEPLEAEVYDVTIIRGGPAAKRKLEEQMKVNNTSGFLHAGKEGKVGGLGSFMGSVSMPFAPGKHGIFGDAGGLGSKDEARNDIWSKDTSAARISGAFGGLVGSVGNSAGGFLGSRTKGAGLVTSPNPRVSGAEWSARPSVVTWNLGGRIPENTSGFLHARKEGKVGGLGSFMRSLSMPFAPGKHGIFGDAGGLGSKDEARNDIWSKDTSAARISGAFGGLAGSVGNSAGGFLGSRTKGVGLVTSPNPRVSGAEWSARPSVVTWNLGGRIPENTSGFLHARKEGKVGGLGSFMGSVSMPFAPRKHGIFGDAGGLGSKDEARNDIWSKDTSAARISGAFGVLVGSVGNSASVDGDTCRTGGQKAAGEDENKVLRLKLAALEEMKEKDAREIADLKKKLAAKAPQGMSSVFGGMVGSVTTGAGGFLGSMTKGAGLVTGPNPRVSGAEWSARPSVVTWNLGGRIPENTSGFLHARKEGKVGGLGSLMGSVSMPFAPGKHGIFGDAGGLGSKDEARNDIWSKDTSAARISGVWGGLIFGDNEERGSKAVAQDPVETSARDTSFGGTTGGSKSNAIRAISLEDAESQDKLSVLEKVPMDGGFNVTRLLKYTSGLHPSVGERGSVHFGNILGSMTARAEEGGSKLGTMIGDLTSRPSPGRSSGSDTKDTDAIRGPDYPSKAAEQAASSDGVPAEQTASNDRVNTSNVDTSLRRWDRNSIPPLEFKKLENVWDDSGWSFVRRKDEPKPDAREAYKMKLQGLPSLQIPDRLPPSLGTVEIGPREWPDIARLPMCYMETTGRKAVREERVPERQEDPKLFLRDLEDSFFELVSERQSQAQTTRVSREIVTWKRPLNHRKSPTLNWGDVRQAL